MSSIDEKIIKKKTEHKDSKKLFTMEIRMQRVAKKHWKNGLNYRYKIRGTRKYLWSCSFRLGRFGIMICKPSKIVPLVNFYEII